MCISKSRGVHASYSKLEMVLVWDTVDVQLNSRGPCVQAECKYVHQSVCMCDSVVSLCAGGQCALSLHRLHFEEV